MKLTQETLKNLLPDHSLYHALNSEARRDVQENRSECLGPIIITGYDEALEEYTTNDPETNLSVYAGTHDEWYELAGQSVRVDYWYENVFSVAGNYHQFGLQDGEEFVFNDVLAYLGPNLSESDRWVIGIRD